MNAIDARRLLDQLLTEEKQRIAKVDVSDIIKLIEEHIRLNKSNQFTLSDFEVSDDQIEKLQTMDYKLVDRYVGGVIFSF